MSPPIFNNVAIIDLPKDTGDGEQSYGTWRALANGRVRITCPECWDLSQTISVDAIDKAGTTRLDCKCGLDRMCKLVGYKASLKGGTK